MNVEGMKTRKVNRYYCDFCTKANCSASAMGLHEKHCTMNPNRQCRMCCQLRNIPVLTKMLPSSFSAYYDAHGNPISSEYLIRIRVACQKCPACILAVLRQSGVSMDIFSFDFKEEAKVWFEGRNGQWR